jgi:ribose transport system substrate-binding protein
MKTVGGLKVLVVSGCLLTAACGGGSTGGSTGSSSNANVSQADQLVKQEEAPQSTWKPAGSPFNASALRGKTMWYLSVNLSIPFEQYMVQGMKEGGATVGVNTVGFDAQSSVAQMTRGIEEAVQAKAGVIFIDGFPANLVAPAIAQAKAAGIPVLTANSQGPGPMLPGAPDGVVGTATHPFADPGRIEADWIVADSKGNANIIYLRSSDVPVITDLEKNAFVSEINKLCSSCKLQVVDVPTSQWNQLTTKTASLIRANPNANYFVPDFDGEVIFMVPGVTSANAQNRVKIVSFNATPSVMQNLKNHYVVAAETGGPNLLQGWAFADQGMRVMAGQQPLQDLNIPTRLFDYSNIGSIDLSAQESEWYGVGDYRAKFKAQWGVSS